MVGRQQSVIVCDSTRVHRTFWVLDAPLQHRPDHRRHAHAWPPRRQLHLRAV